MKHKQCEGCKKWITPNEAWYSLRAFGKELCFSCQAPYKAKKGLFGYKSSQTL
jgi:hypothetical protein